MCKAINTAAGQTSYAVTYHIPIIYHLHECLKCLKEVGMFSELSFYTVKGGKQQTGIMHI